MLCPPPKLCHKSPLLEPFSGLTFLCFWEKALIFWNYPTKSYFIKSVKKVNFTSWNPILFDYFSKHKVVPLSFFLDFSENSNRAVCGINILYFWLEKSKIFDLPHYMFYQKSSKRRFYRLQSNFVPFFVQNTIQCSISSNSVQTI